MKLSEEAKEARRRYLREWKSKNPDKVKASIARYWEKKAAIEDEPIEIRIIQLHDQGFSLREIAAKVGINHVQVSRMLSRYK